MLLSTQSPQVKSEQVQFQTHHPSNFLNLDSDKLRVLESIKRIPRNQPTPRPKPTPPINNPLLISPPYPKGHPERLTEHGHRRPDLHVRIVSIDANAVLEIAQIVAKGPEAGLVGAEGEPDGDEDEVMEHHWQEWSAFEHGED